MIALIIIVVVLVAAVAAVSVMIRNKNQQADIERADQLRRQAAGQAQAQIPPAQDRAAVTEAEAEEARAEAEEARARAEQAEAEAHEARTAAQHVEASHEAQLRAADRLDPRVDHRADDYQPQVPGTVDQQPTAPPADVTGDLPTHPEPTTEPPAGTTTEAAPVAEEESEEESEEETGRTPLLPRRTPGAQEMPGKPIETDGTGGWFTRKDPDQT